MMKVEFIEDVTLEGVTVSFSADVWGAIRRVEIHLSGTSDDDLDLLASAFSEIYARRKHAQARGVWSRVGGDEG